MMKRSGLKEFDGVGEPGAKFDGEELEADGGEKVNGKTRVLGVITGEKTDEILLKEGISKAISEILLTH